MWRHGQTFGLYWQNGQLSTVIKKILSSCEILSRQNEEEEEDEDEDEEEEEEED